MATATFPPAGLKLLGTLNRNGGASAAGIPVQAYDALLRQPTLEFARAVNRHMAGFAREYQADPRRIGVEPERAFRRDRHGMAMVTEIVVDFPRAHTSPKDAASFRVRISASGIEVCAGVWRPGSRALARLRAWILTNHGELECVMGGELGRRVGPPHIRVGETDLVIRARTGAAFRDQLLHAGEVWWLARLAPSVLTSGGLDKVVAGHFRLMLPCVRMLTAAMQGASGHLLSHGGEQ